MPPCIAGCEHKVTGVNVTSLDKSNQDTGNNPATAPRHNPGLLCPHTQHEYTNWHDDQQSWITTVALFDRSFHEVRRVAQ